MNNSEELVTNPKRTSATSRKSRTVNKFDIVTFTIPDGEGGFYAPIRGMVRGVDPDYTCASVIAERTGFLFAVPVNCITHI